MDDQRDETKLGKKTFGKAMVYLLCYQQENHSGSRYTFGNHYGITISVNCSMIAAGSSPTILIQSKRLLDLMMKIFLLQSGVISHHFAHCFIALDDDLFARKGF